jgi:hypothetical protein
VKQVTVEVVLREVKTQKEKQIVVNRVKAEKRSGFLGCVDGLCFLAFPMNIYEDITLLRNCGRH